MKSHPNPRLWSLLLLPLALALGCAGGAKQQDRFPHFEGVEELPDAKPVAAASLNFEEEVRLADQLRDLGEDPEAAWHYLRGLQLDQLSPIPKQRLGFMQLTRDVARAEKIFEQLVADHPELVSGRLGLGLARIASGKHEEARACFVKALELDSSSAVAHVGLGMIDDKLGRYARAQVHYQQAHERDPSRYEIKNNLGMSYLISGRYDKAREAFLDAIFLEPRDPAIYNNLAIATALEGDHQEAVKLFRKYSIEADALNNIGYVCLMNGEYRRAVKYFEHSLLKGPTHRRTVLVNLRSAEDALLAQ
jgi:Flp pilus assembly protein TadD